MQRIFGVVAMVLLATPLAAATPAVEQAAAFTVQLYGGGTVDSRSLAGRVVILNFWASWCAPCKRELAELDAVLARHGSARVAVFAIDAGTRTEARLLDRQAATMRVPVATGITAPYRPRGGAVPTTFVIDPRGRIVTVQAGAFRPGEIARLVDGLLAATSERGR